jgi:uncharacterized protein (DUF305 family)
MNTKTDTTSIKINFDEISKGQSSQIPDLTQRLIDSKDLEIQFLQQKLKESEKKWEE